MLFLVHKVDISFKTLKNGGAAKLGQNYHTACPEKGPASKLGKLSLIIAMDFIEMFSCELSNQSW